MGPEPIILVLLATGAIGTFGLLVIKVSDKWTKSRKHRKQKHTQTSIHQALND